MTRRRSGHDEKQEAKEGRYFAKGRNRGLILLMNLCYNNLREKEMAQHMETSLVSLKNIMPV